MIANYIEAGIEKLLILDDDLAFSMHNPIPYAKPDFKLLDEFEMETLFEHILDLTCQQMPIMSFTPIMARSQPHLISYCKPMMMAYAYHLPHFKEHPEHRFWIGEHIEARCDLNISLKMLTQGYLTGFMASCFIPDNVNNPGGCSIYRDLEMEKKSVAFLREQYPDFTIPRWKKGWVGDPDVIRPAVTIKWKQAFNRTLFKENFGVPADMWARQHLAKYEKKYSAFVKEIRENAK
jgi:hypothetical protein